MSIFIMRLLQAGENKIVATQFGSKLSEQVKKYQKAARLADAARSQTDHNRAVSDIARLGRDTKAQIPPKQ